MIDLIILIIGLTIFFILKLLFPHRNIPSQVLGKPVIIKAHKQVIHIGNCHYVSLDGLVECLNNEGLIFYANLNKLFWSEGEQAYIEHV